MGEEGCPGPPMVNWLRTRRFRRDGPLPENSAAGSHPRCLEAHAGRMSGLTVPNLDHGGAPG
jgi:hypothetical protein